MSGALAYTAGMRPDRVVALGVLALRAMRHVAVGRPLAGPPIEGLRVEALGAQEAPGWHGTTGLYGFLRLPPGLRRLRVTDPVGRFQPMLFEASVPDRGEVRRQLEAGVASPSMNPRPLVREVALHPSPLAPLPNGVSVAWGQVRDAQGRGVALARLMLTTMIDGALRRHLGWSAADGSYALLLPNERPETIGGDPPWRVTRQLVVHAPRTPLAAALSRDFLAALPAERDALDPDAPGAAFERRGFVLRDAAGVVRNGPPGADPTLPILGGRQSRWDIELA
jgi:hypothetical protein